MSFPQNTHQSLLDPGQSSKIQADDLFTIVIAEEQEAEARRKKKSGAHHHRGARHEKTRYCTSHLKVISFRLEFGVCFGKNWSKTSARRAPMS
mmetsp:Transcript_236/g.418  ORF Transcript_236/g.418 Transcript_236/m.418 type:complete len:93 (+) Transcript_236:807-1085(+)